MFHVEQIKYKTLKENSIKYIESKDYMISNEKYELYKNNEFDLLLTYPIPENLSKYYNSEDYISHTDSKKTIYDIIYQTIKKYSLNKKLKLINSFNPNNKEILDIGAGTGDFLNICKKDGWKVNGIEPSENARKLAYKKDINLKSSIEKLNNDKYDVITMWHVLEHVTNLDEYITTLKKLLKPNGTLIIAVPNYNSYDAKHYKSFWAAYDVPRHIWHFSKKSISKLFELVNMEVVKIIPMKFDSYYVSLLSEKYKNGYKNPIRAFLIGFKSNLIGNKKKEHSSHIYIIKNSK